MNIFRKIKELCIGFISFREIKKKYGNEFKICVSQHPALGDAYLAGLYLKNYYKNKSFVVTAISLGSIEVYEYLNIKHIFRLSLEKTDCLIQFCQFMGIKEEDVLILHHQALKWHTGIAWNFHGVNGISFADVFEAMVFPNLLRSQREYPINPEFDISKNNFRNIKKNKSVVLFPYSNTLYSPAANYWDDLAGLLKNMGYYVFTYIFNFEKPINGTSGISCPIREINLLVEYAGMFIGIRNGITDIISRASCKKIVLYPSTGGESWIHGKIIDFWSLKSFGYANDVQEYIWDEIIENGKFDSKIFL